MTRRGVLIQGLTSADLRNSIEDWFFRPVARYLFHIEPKLRGLVLGVTEYYNDNWDQVYLRLLPTCDSQPRWPDSFTEDYTHAESPGGLTAREQERLVEAAVQTLFGVAAEELTDASLVHWRFAFESVIPEGTYAERPWAERYVPYLTALRKDSGEPIFHKSSGLARPYAENRLSLLAWKKGTPLDLKEEAPPLIEVPPLAPTDWRRALAALNEIESWQSCLLELLRSASMLVDFVREASHHGALSAAGLRAREETALLQESIQHLAALFGYVGLLAAQRVKKVQPIDAAPGQLRLYGSSAEQLRDWFQAMYFAPLARLVLQSYPEAKNLTLYLAPAGQDGDFSERARLGSAEQSDVTADWHKARKTLYGLNDSVVRRDSLRFAFGDLRLSADQPLLELQSSSGETRWLGRPCAAPSDTSERSWYSQAPNQEGQDQRVAEILSVLDRAEDFAAPLNACLAACSAYLAHPSAERVWELAATLPNLQFLLEVLGVDMSRLQ